MSTKNREDRELPSGEVTFFFSDIEGSTTRWERDADVMRAALVLHDHHTRAAIDAHDGVIVKHTGDGVFAAFACPVAAVRAAVALQCGLVEEVWPGGDPLRVRIGIHTSAATPDAGDYHGRAVNRCARVMAAAHGGQVLITDETAQQLADDSAIRLDDLGFHRLRDFDRTTRLHQVLHEGMPSDFPPLRTLDQFPNNLPETASSMVGRGAELQRLIDLLGDARLVTLTGAGGVGKTRLAVQLGAEVLEHHPDGVWLVELGTLQTPELVERAIASALRVPDQPGRSIGDALLTFMATRTALVVLDNCEHLLSPVAAIVESLLRCAPNLRVVATSREPLAVAGEHVFNVPPLPVDETGDAVQLFLQRAGAASADFDASGAGMDAVSGICRRLDGLPLAIELAASRVRVLSVDEIAGRLDDRFRLLTGGSRTALPRQRTLEATVAWSYDLLPDEEKRLFCALSVFASPFRLADAEVVVGGTGMDVAVTVVDGVLELADRSLLVVETRGGETRYRMLETVRAYARHRLAELGGTETLYRAHAGWAAARAREITKELDGPQQVAWLDTVESMVDDFRAAMAWSHDDGSHETGASVVTDLYRYWYMRSVREGSEWYGRFVTSVEQLPAEMQARLRYCHGSLLQVMGRYEVSTAELRAAVQLYRNLDQPRGLAYAIHYLVRSQWGMVPHEENHSLIQESLDRFRSIGDPVGEGLTLMFASLSEYVTRGSVDAGLALMEECDRILREIGAPQLVAHGAEIRAFFLGRDGRAAEAAPLMREALNLYAQLRNPNCGAHCLENLALLVCDQQPGNALELLAATERLRAEIGVPAPPYENLGFTDANSLARSLLAPVDVEAAWQRGANLDFDAALEVARHVVSRMGDDGGAPHVTLDC